MISIFRILPSLALVVASSFLHAQPSIGPFHVYYGHLHNHSQVSDGVDSPEQAYRYAHESGHLDFFGLSDHSEQIHGDEWEILQKAADQYNIPGEYTTFCGFEWTDQQLGHVTVLHTSDYTTPLSCNYSFSDLCNWLNERDAIAFFNHPGVYNRTGREFDHFEGTPSNKLVGIELWNRGDRFERFYRTAGYFPDDNKSWYDEALARGWNIGAAGSEDNHEGNYGNATPSKLAILAPENTREALYQALKARRFYTTYDSNLALSFQINGSEMGSEVKGGNDELQILATEEATERFTSIELLKNGTVVQSWSPNTDRVTIRQPLRCGQGDYYYVHVVEQDGDEALSSPIRISRINQPPRISLSSPRINTPYLHPASVTLQAEAQDDDGSIEKVEFYVQQQWVGQSDQSPYSFTWESSATGTFELQAKATDNNGDKTLSAPVRIVVTDPGQPVTVWASIASPLDDAEESQQGSMSENLQSTDIELAEDNGTRSHQQTVGLRFTDLNIPRGVFITSARVQFTCDEVSLDSCRLSIAGEASSNSAAFTPEPFNVSQRSLTQARVPWVPQPWPQEKESTSAQQSPDLKAIVQEIIDQPGDTPPGAITLIITGTGTRTAVAYEGDAPAAPVMRVTYSATRPNDPPRVSLALEGDNTPRMAPALVTLKAQALDSDGKIEKVDFYLNQSLLASLQNPPYTFQWNEVPEGDYLLHAVATDDQGDTAISPALPLRVIPEVATRSFTTPIGLPGDDATESCKGRVNLSGDNLRLVYDSRCLGRLTVGLRFTNVQIPPGAVIKKACLQFTSQEKTTMDCSLVIQGENSDNSTAFSPATNDLSARPRTHAIIGWRAARWPRAQQSTPAEQTPDLKTIVQEIINRPGWTTGKNLSFLITGMGIGQRTAVSFEACPPKAARLVVDYEITIHRN